MSFPFVTVDELRRMEPDFGRAPQDDERAGMPSAPKTPVMLLLEGAMRAYGSANEAKFQENHDGTHFRCVAILRTFKGEAKARVKKTAKQMASHELLKNIVKGGRHTDYNLPGGTQDEAMEFLNSLIATMEEGLEPSGRTGGAVTASVEAATENWVGKLNELCQKNRIESPDYTSIELGSQVNRTFRTTCRVNKNETSHEAKTKKASKMAAAMKMHGLIDQQLGELQKSAGDGAGHAATAGEVEDEEEEIEGILSEAGIDVSAAETDPNPMESLRKILDDETKFQMGAEIKTRQIPYPSTNGDVQTLLTVKCFKASLPTAGKTDPPTQSQKPMETVFAGEGVDAALSEANAARCALIHFMTY